MLMKSLLLFAALAAVVLPAVSRADGDAFVQVSALLDAGWRPSTKGLAAAEAIYEELRREGRPDPRLMYAFALVQMRNQEYDEAKKLLDLVLAADKHDIAARRARTWVLMITQKYAAALVDLESLVKQVVAQPADAESDSTRLIEFAGRVMGFIDGPAASALQAHVRADYRKRLAAPLSAARRESFDEGYKAVQQRFAELNLDRQQTKADAKADEQRRQERILQELERERADLAKEKSSLQERAEKVAVDLNRELTNLDAQLRPLATRQARLEAQGAAIVREMAGLQVEITRLLELSDLVEEPVEALRLRAEARRLDIALGRYGVDLRALEGESAGVAAQRIALARQRQLAVAQQRAHSDRIERRVAEMRRTERRISGQEDRANQPGGGATAAVVSLSTRAKAFTTYEDFPFEEERARLLQSLAK
ncbi:MAG: tetratricopeptide repeat protein [Pirellulales bacterium]